MGESKRRKLVALSDAPVVSLSDIRLPDIASALRRLASAASGQLGGDCWMHHALGQAILERLGVHARICVGFAAWRVGPGDGDVILHYPTPNMPEQPGGVPYHAWLEVDGQIIDLSVYQLRQKAFELDAMDGGKTLVEWCPDYLCVPQKSAVSLNRVRQETAGLYAYEGRPEVERRIREVAPELDEEDLAAAWFLYHNPGVKVVGPNDIARI